MAQTTKKSNTLVTGDWNDQTGEMWFKVEGFERFTFQTTKAHQKHLKRAMYHGFYQRFIDVAAIGTNDKDGNLIPLKVRLAEKHKKMLALKDHYESGNENWGFRAERVVSVSERDEWTKMAIQNVLKWTPEVLETKLAALAEKRRETVAKTLEYFRTTENPVRPEYEKIRDAQDAQVEGEGEDVFAELKEME